MYLNLLLLPLAGALSTLLFGRKLGATGAQIVSPLSIAISAVLAVVAFYEVALCGSPVTVELGSWIDSALFNVNWTFTFDSLTVSMLLAVLGVSAFVHVYAVWYMDSDPHVQRFMGYLSMFTFFMVVLVTGDNYVLLFLGWEGIGVTSYLLISFRTTRIQANKSGLQALVMNRIGDAFFSFGLFILFRATCSIDYSTAFSVGPYINETVLSIIGICFLLAATGKSAQLGLHTRLPSSMEGPTPVSALLHAATLVTAGIYLLLRSSPLLEYAPTVLLAITWLGALTAFFAATTGLVQNDLKRVIAFSTCSQMGYLLMGIGMSQYSVALLHLVNHAFFKSLLFLAAGGILHSMNDQQNLRRLGGLMNSLPFTFTIIMIASLSLMAIPFTSGFYSKDVILETGIAHFSFSGTLVYWLGTITAGLTAFYSYRLIAMVFLTTPNGPRHAYEHTHEQPMIVVIPFTCLALLSVFSGYLLKEGMTGLGSDLMSHALFTHPSNIVMIEAEFGLPTMYKLIPFIVTVLGATLSIVLYEYKPHVPVSLAQGGYNKVYNFLLNKWYYDAIFHNYVIGSGLKWGMVTSKILDKGVIELMGPLGLSTALSNSSNKLATLDTGILTQYALYILIGILSVSLVVFITRLNLIPESMLEFGSERYGGVLPIVALALLVFPFTNKKSEKSRLALILGF